MPNRKLSAQLIFNMKTPKNIFKLLKKWRKKKEPIKDIKLKNLYVL